MRKSDFFLGFIEYLLKFSKKEGFIVSKIDFLSFMNRKKISQTELAEVLDVHQSAVSQYVSGKSGVVFDKVEKLVELGITPEELFGETAGKKMRDSIIRDYLSKSGDITTQNSLEIVKEGLIEILKRI
jgi:predicted transcriptional regulator